MRNFEEVINAAKRKGPKTIAVAAAHDDDVLKAIKVALNAGIVRAILIGNEQKIKEIASRIELPLKDVKIHHEENPKEMCLKAVSLVSSGEAHILMKGLVDTSVILSAVLDKNVGLRTGSTLSHVAVFFVETYHKMLMLTDAAMNIEPDAETKRQILENAVAFAHSMGIECPKCAVVCAKESVSKAMKHTIDAQTLVEANIPGCIVGGPFALDNAISKAAAEHKGIQHEVAGDADILLMPQIEAGNVLYKALTFLAKAESAGLILGAKAPIVLTSRADSDIAKLNSIALSVLHA